MLDIPIDPRSVAFDAVDRRLRADPVLKRIIRHWASIPVQIKPPSASELPLMVIGLKPGNIGMATPNSFSASLIITIDYMIPGLDPRDIINLYGVIETAIDPFGNGAWLRDPIVATGRATLHGQPMITQQGYSYQPIPEYNAIGGSAAFSIPMKINPTRC